MGQDGSHDHSEAHVRRAFDRARRVLAMVTEMHPEALPSVELHADGSAAFHFPPALAKALTPAQSEQIRHLVGSNRVMAACPPAEGTVSLNVCCTLGREVD